MQTTTDRSALEALAKGFTAVAEKAAAKAGEVAALLVQAMQTTTNPDALQTLVEGFEAVTKNLDRQQVPPQQLVDLLKLPLCVGKGRRVLVDLFNDKFAPDEKLDGNVWKLVAWAEQQGLDVRSPPRRPETVPGHPPP
jgi:hypothetical protein